MSTRAIQITRKDCCDRDSCDENLHHPFIFNPGKPAVEVSAMIGEAGAKLHYLNGSPFPLREFSVKSARVQYVAGNTAVSEALLNIINLR